ncbi:VWA domain-containing protein [Marinobacter halodurans]|uniref:VWA domain-containing protein n=1 Tax=Marinobacter halodurans TaxID=2528979 RepID=A0ABY1ZLQ7_9GAMM|nr:VWA domain-containing protein [Marinobacter halodurans]TBW56627.1 VWA domain-containing protein [Marinobacter halodurans]
MADFHFMRPLWLLLLVLLPLIPFLLRFQGEGQSGWARVIPEALLRPLLGDAVEQNARRKRPGIILGTLVIACALALAGPSWREAPTPLMQENDSLVIVLDLSLSMLAQDVDPDRLTQAKRKIRDILAQRRSSFTALVVYSGDAHTVTPLTDDSRTIESLLDVLDPFMMPASGNRADLAVEQAERLLDQGAPGQGRILLVTDALRASDYQSIRETLQGSPYSLSTLVVGTREGGPIPLPKRGFIRDGDHVVIAKAQPDRLAQLASATGGLSSPVTLDDDDIRTLELRSQDSDDWHESKRDLMVKRWKDDGYWLLWLAAPLALIAWRRGALLLIPLVLLPLLPQPAQAMDWEDWWTRPDQRAEALIQKDPAVAADKLDDSGWKGSALYRAGDYDRAASAFAKADSADAQYNRGNALARKGDLKEALAAYDKALEKDPGNQDARFNRDLVKKLLEQQKQQKKQNQQNQGNKQSDQQKQQGQSGQGQQNKPNQGQSSSQQQQDSQQGQNPSQQDQNADQGKQGQQNQSRQSPGQQQEDESSSQGQSDQQPGQSDEKSGQQAKAQPAGEAGNDKQLSQSQEQWLRRIPDDPSGLMRRKFLYQYRERGNQQQMEGDTPW